MCMQKSLDCCFSFLYVHSMALLKSHDFFQTGWMLSHFPAVWLRCQYRTSLFQRLNDTPNFFCFEAPEFSVYLEMKWFKSALSFRPRMKLHSCLQASSLIYLKRNWKSMQLFVSLWFMNLLCFYLNGYFGDYLTFYLKELLINGQKIK